MDLRLLSKDHAVTVAVCDDTLTEIRYTTLKDTTRRDSLSKKCCVSTPLQLYQ